MTPEQWARVKALVERALDLPAEQRQSWVAAQAGSDPDLRREVEALLDAHDRVGTFLDGSPAASHHPHVFASGTRLGRFEILDELGRGGAGIVYLARDHVLGRRVALKLVASGADPHLRERLRQEARAAANISHPAVAAVHTLEEFDDQLFIVSEYVRGRTLRAVLANGPLPPDEALAIAVQIAGALRAAHEAGVVHRDLKPENVLLTDSGAVKVVDFGIARIDGASTQLTREGAFLGTPGYMAPEQLLGTPADARADIYACGIVLAEMLAGRHPGLPGGTNTHDPAVASLSRIAQQCTQLDPGARFQTAALLLAALERARSGTDATRSGARWWWEFHQAVVATVYCATVWPAWLARTAIGGSAGRTFFIVVVLAVVVSAFLRLHLWFTSRFYPDELSWVRRRSSPWITAGDGVLVAALLSGALLIREEHSSLDAVLLSIAVGAAVAFLVIEAATTRAAFGRKG